LLSGISMGSALSIIMAIIGTIFLLKLIINEKNK